jgi:hypothetical protein
MKYGNPHIELSKWNMVGGIHTLVENGNEMGYPHNECAPAQGIRTLFYMLCYVDEVVNTQYRKRRERGGPKGKKSCRPQAMVPVEPQASNFLKKNCWKKLKKKLRASQNSLVLLCVIMICCTI